MKDWLNRFEANQKASKVVYVFYKMRVNWLAHATHHKPSRRWLIGNCESQRNKLEFGIYSIISYEINVNDSRYFVEFIECRVVLYISNPHDWCYSIYCFVAHPLMRIANMLAIARLHYAHTNTHYNVVVSSSFHTICLTFLRHGYDCFCMVLFIPSSICLIFWIRCCCASLQYRLFSFHWKMKQENNNTHK